MVHITIETKNITLNINNSCPSLKLGTKLKLTLERVLSVYKGFLLRGNDLNNIKKFLSQGIELNLAFCGKDRICSLNKKYRGEEKITDVLSFPVYNSLLDDPTELVSGAKILLGDVYICKDMAEAQAKEYNFLFEQEVARQFIHALLHLLGYDHETNTSDAKKMKKEESILLKKLGIDW